VAAVAELLLVARTESMVRFISGPGMALQIIITAINHLLTFAGLVSAAGLAVVGFNWRAAFS